MEHYIAANQSPGQYGLVVDQNLSQRYPSYFVSGDSGSGGSQSVPLNLLSSNSFYTNQLNSSLNGKNVGLNTQDKNKRPAYRAVHLNSSFPNSGIDHMGNEMLNARLSLMHSDLNSSSIPLTYLNHFEKQQHQQHFKTNHMPFATNNLSNNESQNGHPFIHPQLKQNHQPQQILSNSNKNNPTTVNVQSTQLSGPKGYSVQPPQMHSNYLHHIDKDKLLGLDKQIPLNLYLNSPINLNNKRPRLNTENKSYNPLMIDTMLIDFKKDGVYNPQVEAISPTNLEDRNNEQNAFKNQILQSLEKLDREIKQKESSISKFRKQQKELEASTNSSSQNQIENLDPNDLKQLSTTQQVYTENKQKADESQKKLDDIRPLTIAPLYNQPSDLSFYFANKNKFKWFKPKLVRYFKKRLRYKQKREKYLTTTYEKLMNDWLKSVESKSYGMKKSKELKNST